MKKQKEKEVTLTLSEVKDLFCTKKDIEEIAITMGGTPCLTWLKEPYCWFEDAVPKKRNVFRKLAKQMNFLRKLKGQKELVLEEKK